MFYMIFIYLVLQTSICNAELEVKPIATVDLDHDVSSSNSCSSGTSGLDCVRSRLEEAYAYVRPELGGQDELSDADKIFLALHDKPNYWQATDQDTLKQVLIIHRHGDRTPINFPPQDNVANEPFWQFHGLGQLTNRGKARLHLLGRIIRERYDEFLQKSVNKNIRKSRSSGALRCIESAQVFLSSFMALTKDRRSPDSAALIWDKPSNELSQIWQPASVNTLAAKYDALLNEGAKCNNAEAVYADLDDSEENKRLMKEYSHERETLKRELGFEVDHFYKWFWASSLIEVEKSYFGDKLKPAITAIYDRLEEAGNMALVLFQTPKPLRRARVGLLIDDIIKNMVDTTKSSTSPFNKKFVHYSAHDINLVFLLGVLDNIKKFPYRPDYASNIIFELHEDKGEWFVKFFYMPHVPSKFRELNIEACEQGHKRKRCTLSKFSELMKEFRVSSWWSWMQECDNPLENMDPYEQNS
uniref:Prostatic acid phosphatase n=1 Tax=Aceria tosichella TaxID=561515 RepID=A0A6G1SBY5_9ACAR